MLRAWAGVTRQNLIVIEGCYAATSRKVPCDVVVHRATVRRLILDTKNYYVISMCDLARIHSECPWFPPVHCTLQHSAQAQAQDVVKRYGKEYFSYSSIFFNFYLHECSHSTLQVAKVCRLTVGQAQEVVKHTYGILFIFLCILYTLQLKQAFPFYLI